MNRQLQLPDVTLRAMEPEDLGVLYETENDMALWDVGYTNVPYSRHNLLEYIVSSRNDIFADGQVRLMAENMQHDTVGIVDLINFDPRHRRAELGIVTRKEFRRQGYATSMVSKIVDYARRIVHLHQVYAVVGCENTPCIDLLKKAGFAEGAYMKDWLFDGEKYQDACVMQLFL